MNKKSLRVTISICIIIPLVIHLLYSVSSPAAFLESKWSAGELLTYLGTFVAAYLAYKGVKNTIEENKRIHHEDLINSVKPYIAIEPLYVRSTYDIFLEGFYSKKDDTSVAVMSIILLIQNILLIRFALL